MKVVKLLSRWVVCEEKYDADRIEKIGNRFLLSNGYMGYRGTLEEHTKKELAGCTLAGLYDQAGDQWREPVNAPNGLFTQISCDNEPLTVSEANVMAHTQSLDIRRAVHTRRTEFTTKQGKVIDYTVERFLSISDIHLICMMARIVPQDDCRLELVTGIDGEVWDINGPHLKDYQTGFDGGILTLEAKTGELGHTVALAEAFSGFPGQESIRQEEKRILRIISFEGKKGEAYTFFKFVTVFNGDDGVSDPKKACVKAVRQSILAGYRSLLFTHESLWLKRWETCDIVIEGDDEAQLSLRFSLYHLLSIAPAHSDKLSIPARGLSGQVYKGGIFWDTEMFMLPLFLYTWPEAARNLVMYRIHTLDGARRKAAEYGYRGAFYAWESQENGDDACTLFNMTDVFTNRPMRTYFRDKQIHISADVAYGIWEYFKITTDESILLDGGAEVILECARFFHSYAWFSALKNRYEILDVTGPDEYHERVHNNFFTNRMVKYTLDAAIDALNHLKQHHAGFYHSLLIKLDYKKDFNFILKMRELLYIPAPSEETGIIEQFDRYHVLEDISLTELKQRILNPNEYLGGGNGIATTTKIIKQADVVLGLNLFRNEYPEETKKANWEYYEPRTEHGSSLSACVYAMAAAGLGKTEWAYRYFMKTAAIDLLGDSKLYVGTLYIGGTHPAANGGAWMAAVHGFAGVRFEDGRLSIKPQLPEQWKCMRFTLQVMGQKIYIEIKKSGIRLQAGYENTSGIEIRAGGKEMTLLAQQQLQITF